MPIFETWDLVVPITSSIVAIAEIGKSPRRDFRTIPRRVRRSMARDLGRREFRDVRGLPDPKVGYMYVYPTRLGG